MVRRLAHLPELGADLVTALPALDVHNLTHLAGGIGFGLMDSEFGVWLGSTHSGSVVAFTTVQVGRECALLHLPSGQG